MDKVKCSQCGKELVSGEQMRCVYCELNQVNVHSSQASADTNCGKCNLFTIRDKESLHCELCKLWYHNGCNEFALDDQYCSLVYEAPKNIKWFCDKCIWETEKWINAYTFNSDGQSEDIAHIKSSAVLVNKDIKNNVNRKRKPDLKRKKELPNGTRKKVKKVKVPTVSLQTKAKKNKVKRITRNSSKKTTKSSLIKKEVDKHDERDNEVSKYINNELTIKDENVSDISTYESDDQEFQPGEVSDTDSSYLGQDETPRMKNIVNPGKKVTKKKSDKKYIRKKKPRTRHYCDKCPKKYNSEQLFKAHKLSHETGGVVDEKPFKCPHCNREFKYNHGLKVHEARRSRGLRCRRKPIPKERPIIITHAWENKLKTRIPCDICPKTFNFKESLEAHKLWHAGDKEPYKCHICNKGFMGTAGLKYHILKHSDVRSFICEICGKGFVASGRLKSHMYVAHTDEKPFSCTECDFKTKLNSGLKVHILKMHKDYQCAVCDFETRIRSNFRDHMKTHPVLKNLICDECGYLCKYQHELKLHKSTHSSERPFKCELCGMAFKRFRTMAVHMVVHDKTKKNFCPVCGTGFACKDRLDKHVKAVHTDAKPFECERCGNKYKTKHNLKHHQMGIRGTCHGTNTNKQTIQSVQKTQPSSESIASESNSSESVHVIQYNQQPPPLMVYTGGNNQPMAPVYSSSHVTATIHCPPPALSVFTGHYMGQINNL